jgi:hypothetical protein
MQIMQVMQAHRRLTKTPAPTAAPASAVIRLIVGVKTHLGPVESESEQNARVLLLPACLRSADVFLFLATPLVLIEQNACAG